MGMGEVQDILDVRRGVQYTRCSISVPRFGKLLGFSSILETFD